MDKEKTRCAFWRLIRWAAIGYTRGIAGSVPAVRAITFAHFVATYASANHRSMHWQALQ